MKEGTFKRKLKNLLINFIYCSIQKISWEPKILSMTNTINLIVDNKYSVTRYGDGEFQWVYGLRQESFQKNSKLLGEKLKDTILINKNNLLVCLPDTFGELDKYTDNAAEYWKKHMAKYRLMWRKLIQKNRMYGDSNITRPYMEYKNKENSEEIFKLWKKVWKDRFVLIVEGEKTRFGVGNDLLDSAKEVKRFLCPPENAFDKYSEIKKSVSRVIKEIDQENLLILIALGPTATIMAADFANEGVQAIDIGHLDIEYEWFLRGAVEKVPVRGKYVNEAKNMGGTRVEELEDESYLSSILGSI